MRYLGMLTIVIFAFSFATLIAQQKTTAPITGKQKTIQIVPGVNVVAPDPWVLTSRTRNSIELAYQSPEKAKQTFNPEEYLRSGKALPTAEARIAVEVDLRPTHADAVNRLAHIASETAEKSSLLVIAGWPAVERRRTAPLPLPGEAQAPAEANAIYITVAIAADVFLIRFETVLAPGAEPKLADAAAAIARNIHVRSGNAQTARTELNIVSRSIAQPRTTREKKRSPAPTTEPQAPAKPPAEAAQAGMALVQGGVGELEVAVSNDGKHVIVAANSGFSFSDDGGNTFTRGGGTPCVYNGCDGDPALAVGRSGAVYYSWIGFPTNEPGRFPPPNGATDTVSVSTNNGHTFSFAGNAVVCPATTPVACSIPDQPHLAADRFSLSFAGQDRVYLVWRNFSSVSLTAKIVCSNDGGLTWPEQESVDVAGDFPRVAVGADGSVYVAYASGGNIMLRKFSACDAGLTPQPSVVVSTFANVPCPVPGLDRCNNGNILSSPTVSVDPNDAGHVYVGWATSTVVGNDDVRVAESRDGGTTFSSSVRVNSAVAARRFMPWVCATNGNALVSWYDRRSATSTNNDLTAIFAGMVTSGVGGLQVSSDVNVSLNSDPECASGWPCAPRSPTDATSCSVQPQLAGVCSQSFARCDFNQPNCPVAGEKCSTGGGCPKYGDYNGNACVAGRLFAAWASATSPPGVANVSGISLFETSLTVPAPTCPRGLTSCSGVCVNTKTDPDNCGHCGNSCEVRPVCTNGVCMGCPAGTHPCCGGDFCRRTCPICP